MIGWMIMAAASGMQPARAETLTPVPPRITGAIEQSDPRDAQGRRYDEYGIDLTPGQAITIVLTGAATGQRGAVSELQVLGAGATPIRRGMPARGRITLEFRPQAAGTYRVRVVAQGDAQGPYSLSIGPRQARAMGAVIGRAIGAAPVQAPGEPPVPAASAPRSRFIICPGHPRCPR